MKIGANQNQKINFDLGLLRSHLDLVIKSDETITIYVTNDSGIWCFENCKDVTPIYAYAKDVTAFDRRVRAPRHSSVTVLLINYDKERSRNVEIWGG